MHVYVCMCVLVSIYKDVIMNKLIKRPIVSAVIGGMTGAVLAYAAFNVFVYVVGEPLLFSHTYGDVVYECAPIEYDNGIPAWNDDTIAIRALCYAPGDYVPVYELVRDTRHGTWSMGDIR